jgi:putative ABC transport system permease protein
VAKLGLEVRQGGLVGTTSRLPTSAEEDQAKAAMEDLSPGSFHVERGYVSQYSIVLVVLVGAALVVTLAGTFTAVGLAAAEGRADVATLAAVGASPAVRRRVSAAQAGVISGLGAALGVAAGVLAGWCLVAMQRVPNGSFSPGDTYVKRLLLWRLEFPWLPLTALLLGVPLLAVLIGFSATRSRLPLVRRLGQ